MLVSSCAITRASENFCITACCRASRDDSSARSCCICARMATTSFSVACSSSF